MVVVTVVAVVGIIVVVVVGLVVAVVVRKSIKKGKKGVLRNGNYGRDISGELRMDG